MSTASLAAPMSVGPMPAATGDQASGGSSGGGSEGGACEQLGVRRMFAQVLFDASASADLGVQQTEVHGVADRVERERLLEHLTARHLSFLARARARHPLSART